MSIDLLRAAWLAFRYKRRTRLLHRRCVLALSEFQRRLDEAKVARAKAEAHWTPRNYAQAWQAVGRVSKAHARLTDAILEAEALREIGRRNAAMLDEAAR